MNKIKKVIYTVSMTIALLSLTGCKDENAQMYKVDKAEVNEVVEEVYVEHSYIEVTEAENADTDKNLGRKKLVIIDGQPIATLVDGYENNYGYTSNEDKIVKHSRVMGILKDIGL